MGGFVGLDGDVATASIDLLFSFTGVDFDGEGSVLEVERGAGVGVAGPAGPDVEAGAGVEGAGVESLAWPLSLTR